MKTIHHTGTLFEYDGQQLFEARDDEGDCYLALLVERGAEKDRYLVVNVAPELLAELHAGTADLRELIHHAADQGWFLATTSNLGEPLVIESQSTPLPDDLLPEEGFALTNRGVPVTETSARLDTTAPTDSVEVRKRLVRALGLDLIGP